MLDVKKIVNYNYKKLNIKSAILVMLLFLTMCCVISNQTVQASSIGKVKKVSQQ